MARVYVVKRITHVLFATALVSVSGLWKTNMFIFYTIVAMFSSIIPDADLRYMHRKLLHNLFVPVLLAVLVYYPLSWLSIDAHYLASSLVLGWLSHVLLDVVTVKGVYLFYPIANAKVALKICKSDSLLCNTLLSVASLIVIIYNVRALILG